MKNDSSRLHGVHIVAIALFAYATVLLVGLPDPLTKIFVERRASLLFVGVLLFLYAAYRPTGSIGVSTGLSATLILFAAQLSAVWRSSTSVDHVFLLGGLFPMADAAGYYTGILRLLEGDLLTSKAAYRPLSHGAVATIMGLTQHNLQLSVGVLVLITATACFLLAREVRATHGTLAGVVTVAITFCFCRRWIGTIMTENLGLALGAIGLASVWRGANLRKMNWCLLGLFLLTLALHTRAGVFLLLPTLLLWGTRFFRGDSRFSRRFLLAGVGAIALGFIVNHAVIALLTTGDGPAHANFSYTLYGLVTGGNWSTALTDHPELLEFPEPRRSQEVYGLAWQALQADPFALVHNSARALGQFLSQDFVFSFLRSHAVSIPLYILSVAAILVSVVRRVRKRPTPTDALIITAIIGILASIPFVPPWDAGVRVHAAVIPFFSLLPALGLAGLAGKFKYAPLLQGCHKPPSGKYLAAFSLLLTCLLLLGPVAINSLKQAPSVSRISCGKDQQVIYFRNSPGASIHIVSESQRTNLPDVRRSDFRSGLNRVHPYNKDLARELKGLQTSHTVFYTIDVKTKRLVMVIADRKIVPGEHGIVAACVTPKPIAFSHLGGKMRSERPIYYAQSMKMQSP